MTEQRGGPVAASPTNRVVNFGPFELNTETGELRKHGVRVRLQDKPFRVLEFLLEQPQRLVRREDLRARLWGDDTFVDFETSLNAAVRKLRAALSDSARSPRYVETLPRRGYRFIAPVSRRTQAGQPSGRRPAPQSLAVLPFHETGGSEGDDFLADGLTEEITGAVAQIEGLRVASRSSAFYYKGRRVDPREAGETLAVAYLLEGGLRRVGTRLRISLELTEIASGYLVWAKNYDRELHDVLALQQELARSIAASLHAKLRPGRSRVSTSAPDAEAHMLVLQARHEWNRWTPKGWQRALHYYEAASARDPSYAEAHAGVARSQAALGGFGVVEPASAFAAARPAAMRAIRLAPDLSDGYGALAECCALHDWNWQEAEHQFRMALDRNPNDDIARDAFAACCLVPRRRFVEAREHIRKALGTDPLSSRLHAYLGLVHYLSDDLSSASDALARSLELSAEQAFAQQWLALVRMDQGLGREAIRDLEAMVDCPDPDPATLAFVGHAAARAGDRPGALVLLRRIELLGARQYVTPFSTCLLASGLSDWDLAMSCVSQMVRIRDPHLPLALVLPCLRDLRERVASSARDPELVKLLGD